MKACYKLLIIFFLLPVSYSYADRIPWSYNIQTNIDTRNFLNYKITQFILTPNKLSLVYLETDNTFLDEKVTASVTTNVPDSDLDTQLQLKTTKLQTFCYNANQDMVTVDPDFVSIYFDEKNSEEKLMSIGKPMAMPLVSDGNGFLASDFSLWFTFGTIPNEARNCEGQAEFTIEIIL